MQKTKESGRSMVEMLGVLAIIGVLSVGGIAGYTTAINKHRANQILNGASVRAIVVSTQIQRGSETPTLSEFTDNEVGGARFGTGVQNADGTADWTTTDKRFSLTLTGVSTEICTQMKATVGQNSIIREINEGCTTITYNNDLSPNDPEPSGPSVNECTNTCSGGATCVNGYCECSSEYIWNPTDNSGDGSCVEITHGNCTTNADCEEGKYCEIEGSNCNTPNKGVCTPLDNGEQRTYNGKPFLYSSGARSWWAARNWCLAHGKRLVSLSDLSCTKNSCEDWDALIETWGWEVFWTNDSHDSCSVFYAIAELQSVSHADRDADFLYVLCR